MSRIRTRILGLLCARTHTEKGLKVVRIEVPMKINDGERSLDRLIFVRTEDMEQVVVVMPYREMILKKISLGSKVDVRYKKSGRDPAFDAKITYIHPQEMTGVFCQC